MRILHTEWSDGLGGQERRILSEAKGLIDRGHDVTIVCRKGSRIRDEAIKQGIETETIPMRWSWDIEGILRLYLFIKKRRFHVVNTHSGIDSWIGGISARLAGVPLLIRTRHLNIPLKRNILNFIHYLPDVYITCGEEMRMNLIKNCGFPEDKVVSIPTGVDNGFFEVNRDKDGQRRYGIPDDSPVITNIGILRRVKGHEVTLMAVKGVIEEIPHARFLIVGDGPRRKALEGLVDELGIRKFVIFTGYVDDVREILSISDVVVLSSWSEGLPQGILQAMASGVPVVATRVGGVPEVIIHKETGVLVEPGDREALAKGIIRILKDPMLRDHTVRKARELVRSKYTLNHMLDRIETLYREMTKSPHVK
ncbi:MAG: glycosyltransferase family 4 protein [Thermodesulfovibrionia bacterium]